MNLSHMFIFFVWNWFPLIDPSLVFIALFCFPMLLGYMKVDGYLLG